MSIFDDNELERFITDFEMPQHKRILSRNGIDWDDFYIGFTIDELYYMKDYLLTHPIDRDYDLNDLADVSDMVYDYIMWWIFDLIKSGESSAAKIVLSMGYV